MAENIELEMDVAGKKDVSTDEEMVERDTHSADELEPGKSSDSESSSDSEDEGIVRLEIEKLESELAVNPFNYDAHVQRIKLLRKVYEIEMLNKAREEMSAVFPLTSEMWMEWARDEAAQSSLSGPEAFSTLEKLYDRGVSEYLSVPLWCEYLNYAQQYSSNTDVSRIRTLFERAITAAGSHLSEGHKIWEKYREFELNLLCSIDQNDVKERESQAQRVRSLFYRNLSIPLSNMKSILRAFNAWDAAQKNSIATESEDLEGLPSHVALSYQKATKMLNDRLEYEDRVSKQNLSDSDKFQNFMNYLNFEKNAGDPARVQLLYERAIAALPVSSDLWLDYTSYLDKTLKVGALLKNVYSRATKNCSWVGELWVRYLLCLERSHAPEADICKVYESSLQCSFSTMDEYLDLFLTRIDGLRRQSVGKEDYLGDFSLIRSTFKCASEFLSPQMKNSVRLINLHAYWARLEHSLAKDLSAAREVWESLLKISGSMLEAWLHYIKMETELGNIAEARAIYKRCYSKRFPETGSEDICQSWLRFEREFGTLEDLDHAILKVTPRLKELQILKLQQQLKGNSETGPPQQNAAVSASRQKRKSGSDEQSPAKKQKQSDHKQKEIIHNNTNNEATDLKNDDKSHKSYSDQCTAFISNLNLQAKYEDLHKFFGEAGGVVNIRILRDKFTGKSRGLAYVDFSDDQHLASAVAKNRQMLLGKKISIVRSDPKQNKRADHTNSKSQAKPNSRNRKKDDSEDIQLKGSVTFAVPRNVKPLGWKDDKTKIIQDTDQTPKSNDEFRKMFINK